MATICMEVWPDKPTSASQRMCRPHTLKQVMSMGWKDSPAPWMAPERISQ